MADCWQPQASWVGSHWNQGNNQSCLRSSAIRDLMHAFPKPRHNPGRVTKPRSAGNSPTSAGRRRTTVSNTSPMYQHPPSTQNYQAPSNATFLAPPARRTRTNRPISWHPASLEPSGYSSQYFPTTTPDSLALMSMCTQSLDPTDGSMLPPYASSSSTEMYPLQNMQYPAPMQESSFLDMSSQIDPVAWDNGSDLSAIPQPISDGWTFDMMSMNNNMPTADVAGSSYASVPSSGYLTGPSTPDFLPIQQPDDKSGSSKPKQEDELVGMGLYSHPEAFQGSSFDGFSGKGLKLEETFTPSSDNEADDSKDAENEDDDEQESVGNPSPIQNHKQPDPMSYKPVKPAGNMINKSFFFEDDDVEPHVVPAPQQIFNLGNQPCMNYGYGWI